MASQGKCQRHREPLAQGRMGEWNDEGPEDWNNGIPKYWNDGIVE
jgi:hypothetical protein